LGKGGSQRGQLALRWRRNTNAYADTLGNAEPDSKLYADPLGDAERDTDGYADTFGDAERDSDAYSYSHCYTYT
jgi:hypothetical protein